MIVASYIHVCVPGRHLTTMRKVSQTPHQNNDQETKATLIHVKLVDTQYMNQPNLIRYYYAIKMLVNNKNFFTHNWTRWKLRLRKGQGMIEDLCTTEMHAVPSPVDSANHISQCNRLPASQLQQPTTNWCLQ